MTVQAALREAAAKLRARQNKSPEVESGLLLASVLSCDRMVLFMKLRDEISDADYLTYCRFISRRAAGEPLQYITGRQGFMGHVFEVKPGVLIPRYDTETLVECAVKLLSQVDPSALPLMPAVKPRKLRALDIGTGSGIIAICLASSFSDADVFAADISDEALETARGNARQIGVSVNFVKSDLFGAFDGLTFDMIVSNPPYIPSREIDGLDAEVRCHEPRIALDGGDDGLAFYRDIIRQAPKYLTPDGWLLFEVGYGQADTVSELLLTTNFRAPFCSCDINGIARVVGARLNGG